MYQQEIKGSYGEGKYTIYISALVTEDGISVNLTGGERPHVGGVALSVPRQSLTTGTVSCDTCSCDTWLIPVPGHKDIYAAGPASERICKATGEKTVVVAGIHIDHATPEEVQILLENANKATELLLEQIKNLREKK